MAIRRRGNLVSQMLHSDSGNQYYSEQFTRYNAEQCIICSTGRAGEVWDESAVKRLFWTLKIVRDNRQARNKNRKETKADVLDYINCL